MTILALSEYSSIRVVYDLLGKCPDSAKAADTTGMEFVDDHDLRTDLRADLTSATSALRNHEYKVATVLAGSVVESLLLWALQGLGEQAIRAAVASKGQPYPKDPIENWGLRDLIAVSATCNLIPSSTKAQAELAQAFRNLIHPGRASRLSAKCTLGTAYAALAAVDMVASELSLWAASRVA